MQVITPTSEQIQKTLEYYKTLSYKELKQGDFSFLREHKVCNGCGGAGNGVKNRLIRYIIKKSLQILRMVFIEASCDIHDFTYWQWIVAIFTEEEIEKIRAISPKALEILQDDYRKKCDMGFFVAIINDIQRSNLQMTSVLKYTIVALIFYYAVRVWGKEYFQYQK